MKTQKFKILSLRMALLTILLSGLSMQNIYAFSETTKNLPLNGRWEVKARSLSPIPTASYDSQSIYIENPSTLRIPLPTATSPLPLPAAQEKKCIAKPSQSHKQPIW